MTTTLTSTKLYTVAEVADLLQLSEATIRDMAKKRRIPSTMVSTQYRFPETELERWLQEHTVPASKTFEVSP
jgi:excisionase family DNA binding protein